MANSLLKGLAITIGSGLAFAAGRKIGQKSGRRTNYGAAQEWDLRPLARRLAALETRLDQTENIAVSNGARLNAAALQQTVEAVESKLASQRQEMDGLRHDVRAVESRSSEHISTLSQKIESLESRLPVEIDNTIAARMGEMEGRMQTFQEAHSRSLEAFVETLESKVSGSYLATGKHVSRAIPGHHRHAGEIPAHRGQHAEGVGGHRKTCRYQAARSSAAAANPKPRVRPRARTSLGRATCNVRPRASTGTAARTSHAPATRTIRPRGFTGTRARTSHGHAVCNLPRRGFTGIGARTSRGCAPGNVPPRGFTGTGARTGSSGRRGPRSRACSQTRRTLRVFPYHDFGGGGDAALTQLSSLKPRGGGAPAGHFCPALLPAVSTLPPATRCLPRGLEIALR